MEFLKNNKLLVALLSIAIICIVALLVIIFSFSDNDGNNEKNLTTGEEDIAKQQAEEVEEEPLNNFAEEHTHKPYIPDIDEALENEEDKAKVAGLTFGNLKKYEDSINEGSGAILMGGGGNQALFHAFGGNLYLYNTEDKPPFVVEKFTTFGAIDSEGKYVFYTKYNDPVKKQEQSIFIMDTRFYNRTKVGELPAGYTVTSAAFYNDMFVYVASDPMETKYLYGVHKADPSIPLETVQATNQLVNQLPFTKVKSYKNMLYGYVKSHNAIYVLNGNSWVKKYDVPTQYLINFSLSENSVFLYYTDLNNAYYSVNGKVIDDLEGTIEAKWVDDNHLLVINQSNLHVYDVSKEELSPLVGKVSILFTDYKKVYVQNEDGAPYLITVDIIEQ